jgi:cytochrome b561
MGVVLCLMIAGHAGAALFHHFIRKDETLRRMLP